MDLWALLKFSITLEQLLVEFRKWLIQKQKDEKQAALIAACDDYKKAATDDERINAARRLQASTRETKKN